MLSGCVGPDYEKPKMKVASEYKESNIKWKEAKPNADMDRGQWWKMFNDPILDDLIDRLNKNNQDIISMIALYKQSLAIVDEARAGYYPNLSSTYNSTSQKTNESSTPGNKVDKDQSSHSLGLTSSWELDVWGATKYSVASDFALAQSNKAAVAVTRLSAQSSLAQYYFELRYLDEDQILLDEIVASNQKLLNYAKNNYKAGTFDQGDILNTENALYNAKVAASNNTINRDQYSHAIAVLIGESPSTFTIEPIKCYKTEQVNIPISIPSELLQRRPDIAQSEELIKQANAQIGVAKTAFFPSMSLNSSLSMKGDGMGNLLSMPTFVWSVGPQMALGLFDGGYRVAQTKVAQQGYESSVASYRQTVLSAFSEVEDQLASINSLRKQVEGLGSVVTNNNNLLNITINKYEAGIVDYSQVLNSQISYYNAKKSLVDTKSLKRSSEIALIKALGGGWNSDNLEENN